MSIKDLADSLRLQQDPAPGSRILAFAGDILTVSLDLEKAVKGSACLRTNIGHARQARAEILREVHFGEPSLGRDWFDVKMEPCGDRCFKVTLPLCENGHFEAKAFFLPESTMQPVWPAGENISVNVQPADTVCANTIYNAFVRQFGPNKSGGFFTTKSDAEIKRLDSAGYTVIPPSGTFRDLGEHLDFIICKLGCRYIQLLPIHPTPTTYGRMGRFGSPYAAISFTTVDPALARFDPKATPTEQFLEFVDAVHSRGGKLILDIAVNHTGWAALLHDIHPEWLIRKEDGRIEVPGAWGVRWEDLTRLDYTKKELWRYIGRVFLTWCRRGVDGFRCDAGYMIPLPAWKYLIALVREQFPKTVFFLEGLGGKISVTAELLNSANFNWAYSELFQNYDRPQIEEYMKGCSEILKGTGVLIHFAETHDNNRLAARSTTWARMRTALCALLSSRGGFAFANGVEWFATEKIDVHGAPSLNWGSSCNQVEEIKRLTRLLERHPVFFDTTDLKMIQEGEGNFLVVLRSHASGKRLLVLANLDDRSPVWARWKSAAGPSNRDSYLDLLTGREFKAEKKGNISGLFLRPGEVLCLTDDPEDENLLADSIQDFIEPERVVAQRCRAKILEIWSHFTKDVREDTDFESLIYDFRKDPEGFISEPMVIPWEWPEDIRREIMIPPGHFLLVSGPAPFRAMLVKKKRVLAVEESLPGPAGKRFAVFSPFQEISRRTAGPATLHLFMYLPEGTSRIKAPLRFLSARPIIKRIVRRRDLKEKTPRYFMATDGTGGMLRIPVDWGNLTSRYDALLAADPDNAAPSDRWVLWSRCRGWTLFQDYSQQIDSRCLESFSLDKRSAGLWRFMVPTGLGKDVSIIVRLSMPRPGRTVMALKRESRVRGLEDAKPVRIILRPDIESRSFHDVTKAFAGPERSWPSAVKASDAGFDFDPEGPFSLSMNISRGTYVHEPEWQYMVHRFRDAERGQDPDSDLFSPGYFMVELKGGEEVELTGTAVPRSKRGSFLPQIRKKEPSSSTGFDLLQFMIDTLEEYILPRGENLTVIAGFPWFLDWGRDSMIFVRGLVAAGKLDAARSVLMQFGRFEEQGTLPNMIGPDGPVNRDTTDAPLWFMVACNDLLRAEKSRRFLDEDCGGRRVGDVLFSIAESFIRGTANGIHVDPESGLLFSPAHFTWMDTDHPAGTPRQGYPVEIQALWYSSLVFLAGLDKDGGTDYTGLARLVSKSFERFFFLKEDGYLADCLHASPGTGAANAEADDALRPNQLFAITLGLVKDFAIASRILLSCRRLLVPGGIRSLADQQVNRPLPIYHEGDLLNDPYRPYKGRYEGDEDTGRKPAYHNGTAWTWPFPSFCEAWAQVFENKSTAKSWLLSSLDLFWSGCIGHFPEIMDGDFPHVQKGCDAQAWGLSEWIRVAKGLL